MKQLTDSERAIVLERFGSLLASCARRLMLPAGINGRKFLEAALVSLVERGIDKEYSEREVVALAGVVGAIALHKYWSKLCSLPLTAGQLRVNLVKEEHLRFFQMSEWLTSPSWKQRVFFWRARISSLEAESLLLHMYEKYYTLTTVRVS